MPIDAATLALVLAVAVAAFWLHWRSERRLGQLLAERDAAPAVELLQREIASLRGQTSQTLEANLRLVHDQMSQALGQVSQRLAENAEAVRGSHQTIGDRLDAAARVVGDVQKTLGGLGEAAQRIFEVGKDVASLHEILRSPKLRGGFGEWLLGELLAQILPAEHFEMQHEFKSGEKVDAVIRIGERLVPVDSKFPLEDFRRSLEADGDADRLRARKAFLARVRRHVDAIADKYVLPDEGTYDFALMYIPAENVFYETIIRGDGEDEGLAAYAFSRRVVPVSPGSFYAYLQAIVLGLRGLRVEEQARDILAALGRLRGDLERFREDFRLVGKHLGEATKSHASADRRLEKIGDRLALLDSSAPEAEPPEQPSLLPDARPGANPK